MQGGGKFHKRGEGVMRDEWKGKNVIIK